MTHHLIVNISLIWDLRINGEGLEKLELIWKKKEAMKEIMREMKKRAWEREICVLGYLSLMGVLRGRGPAVSDIDATAVLSCVLTFTAVH